MNQKTKNILVWVARLLIILIIILAITTNISGWLFGGLCGLVYGINSILSRNQDKDNNKKKEDVKDGEKK